MNDAPTDWSKVPGALEESDGRFSMDNRLHVQFRVRPILQEKLSEENGRPIYADVECVTILTPGDKLSIIDRIASDDDRRRFADHYAKFQAGKGEEIIGTPLDAVPWMTRSKVEEYRYFGIRSVEQLANANDNVGQKFSGFMADRTKAKNFLEATSGDGARIKELEEQVARLIAASGGAKPKLEAEVQKVAAK